MEYRLNFELVPDSCWYSNLRSVLKPVQWDKIRRAAYAKAGGRCTICGAESRRLEAHERWEYNVETRTQILVDVVAICPACHAVVHIGRTQLMGKEEEACRHFMRVNGCSYAEYRAALGKANEDHRRRNLVPEWKLDLSWLKGNGLP